MKEGLRNELMMRPVAAGNGVPWLQGGHCCSGERLLPDAGMDRTPDAAGVLQHKELFLELPDEKRQGKDPQRARAVERLEVFVTGLDAPPVKVTAQPCLFHRNKLYIKKSK